MANQETRAMIDGTTVTSRYPFIVYGSVRGLVSEHKSERAAFAGLQYDQDQCDKLSSGSYSDAAVYMAHDGEWVPCYDHGADA